MNVYPVMTDKEKTAAEEYRQEHRCTARETPFCKNSFDFIISYGNCGCALAIRCNICRQEHDITDFDNF